MKYTYFTTTIVPRSNLHSNQMKPEHESKKWKAATVLLQYARHTFPRSYVLGVGGHTIRRNRVALRTDSSQPHAGYANIVQQPEPDPDNTEVVPPLPTDTHKEYPAQNYHPDPPIQGYMYYHLHLIELKPRTPSCSKLSVADKSGNQESQTRLMIELLWSWIVIATLFY